MKESDFVSTIGYSGVYAVCDKKLQKSGRSVDDLLARGLFKAAFSKALYDNNPEGQEKVLQVYNDKSGSQYVSCEELKRLFGVFRVPEKITRVKRI